MTITWNRFSLYIHKDFVATSETAGCIYEAFIFNSTVFNSLSVFIIKSRRIKYTHFNRTLPVITSEYNTHSTYYDRHKKCSYKWVTTLFPRWRLSGGQNNWLSSLCSVFAIPWPTFVIYWGLDPKVYAVFNIFVAKRPWIRSVQSVF